MAEFVLLRPFINFMDPCVEAVEKMMEGMEEVGKVVLEAKDEGEGEVVTE